MSEIEAGASRTPELFETLLVIAPVYNEAEGIAKFVSELVKVLKSLSYRYDCKILLVVDPSTDGTEQTVREICLTTPLVSALLMSRRVGHQAALKAGLDHCTEDVCIMMDSDLQHPPSLIPRLLDLYEAGIDVVQTVRLETDGAGPWKRTTSKLYYRLLNRVSEVDLVESGADFRLMSKRVVDIFRIRFTEQNQFLRGLVQWVGFPSATIPFTASSRATGSTKYTLARSSSFALSGIVSFSKAPLRLGLLAGSMVAGIALASSLFAVTAYFSGRALPAGWTTLAVLVSALSAIQLLSLGLIGIYIGAIFDEVKGRPAYLVQEYVSLPPRGAAP